MTNDLETVRKAVADLATALALSGHPTSQPEYRRIAASLNEPDRSRLLTPGERAAAEDRGRALTRDEMIREDRKDILAKARRRAPQLVDGTFAIPIADLAALLEGR